jgi:hypothetical protein
MHRAGSVAFLALIAFLLGACGFGPSETSGSSAGPSLIATRGPETDAPVETESLPPDLPGQSDTAWGPIWDDVPPAYPVPDGAEPADADQGPVSAAYTVPSAVATPRALADYYAAALDEGGYGGTGIDGPLDDGSLTVWSTSGYGCDSLVTILPRGKESLVTVLFGALCRFE